MFLPPSPHLDTLFSTLLIFPHLRQSDRQKPLLTREFGSLLSCLHPSSRGVWKQHTPPSGQPRPTGLDSEAMEEAEAECGLETSDLSPEV